MYGTSPSSLTEKVSYEGSISSESGSFTVQIASLSPSTKYYYKAYMTVWDGSQYKDIEGSTMEFTTPAFSGVTDRGYLDCYEVPAVTVLQRSSGTETHGSTRYQAYTVSNSKQRVATHTFNYNGVKRNYSLLYDSDKKAALWVAFAMNTGDYPWKVSRSDSWKADPAIPVDWQPSLASAYADGTTYSRGHQVASNDRRTTTEQTRQTNYYSNMTPQYSGFNGGMWSQLEGDIQKIGAATSGSDTLYVVTGPIFGAGYTTAADKNGTLCAVPTSYYKCIMKVSFSGHTPVSATGAAYLLEHKNSGSVRQQKTIDEIEQLTGFDFFASVPAALQNAAEAESHTTSYFAQQTVPTVE